MKLNPKFSSFTKSYLRALVGAAAALALHYAAGVDPAIALFLGVALAPIVKFADKSEKEFGFTSKK